VIEEASDSFPVLDEASEVHAANEPERGGRGGGSEDDHVCEKSEGFFETEKRRDR
jgi:hypothetical protein